MLGGVVQLQPVGGAAWPPPARTPGTATRACGCSGLSCTSTICSASGCCRQVCLVMVRRDCVGMVRQHWVGRPQTWQRRPVWVGAGGGGSVAGEFGGGAFGAGVVDQGLAVGGRGDERGGGGVVELAWQPAGDAVQAGDGVVGEQRFGAAGKLQVVGEVGGGLGQVHGGDGVAGGDALVERGEHAKAQLAGKGGLADEDAGEGAGGVHVGVGQQP